MEGKNANDISLLVDKAMKSLQADVAKMRENGFPDFKETGVHVVCTHFRLEKHVVQVCYDYAQEAAEYFSEAQIKPLDTGNAYH